MLEPNDSVKFQLWQSLRTNICRKREKKRHEKGEEGGGEGKWNGKEREKQVKREKIARRAKRE